jgi:DNA-directed RNA polymerase alpha subunit
MITGLPQNQKENLIRDIKKEMNNSERRFITTYSKKFLDSIILLLPENALTYKQRVILELCISENNFQSVAEKFDLTSARISQIFKKALRVASISTLKMKKDYDENYISVQEENELLKKENRQLKNELMKFNKKTDLSKKDSVLLTSIYDTSMSVRLLNVLKPNEIQILDDVLLYTRRDYLRFRNLGIKSLEELEEVLAEYGLELKQ